MGCFNCKFFFYFDLPKVKFLMKIYRFFKTIKTITLFEFIKGLFIAIKEIFKKKNN